MVLAEGRLAVPAKTECVVVPAPAGDPSPLTTHLRADRWLRAALLDHGGAMVRDYLETRVDVRPPVEVLLSPTDGLMRDLPETIPGAPDYDPRNLAWSLVAESPASPIVVPGERIRLRAMCRNTTAQPQQVALDLAWEDALETSLSPWAGCDSAWRPTSSAPNFALRVPSGGHAFHRPIGQRCLAAPHAAGRPAARGRPGHGAHGGPSGRRSARRVAPHCGAAVEAVRALFCETAGSAGLASRIRNGAVRPDPLARIAGLPADITGRTRRSAATFIAPWTGGAITSSIPRGTAADSTGSRARMILPGGCLTMSTRRGRWTMRAICPMARSTRNSFTRASAANTTASPRHTAAADGGGRLLGQWRYLQAREELGPFPPLADRPGPAA